MSEITVLNFHEMYDQIMEDIKGASFLAIDCEFTGLGSSQNSISFFDEPEERYKNMRFAISDLLITQLGITTFEYHKRQNYKVSTYVFYLFPRSYPFSPESFVCDSRSMQFLSTQNYDFNKTVKYGLTYINLFHEREVLKEIKSGKMMRRLKTEMSLEDQRIIQDICKVVYDWLYQSRATGYKILDLTDYDPVRRLLIRHHIELEFKVRTTYVENFKIKIEKGSRTAKEKNDELAQVVMGISGLIKDILVLKKPIVGHNMLMDLMMFYKTFCKPLPTDYRKFKKDIVKIFPAMYDTKLLAYELKKKVRRPHLDTSFNLKRLFDYFTLHREMYPEMPTVEFKPHCEILSTKVHDSGYDSYCTGYVYLHLAHLYSLWDKDCDDIGSFPIGNNPACYFRVTNPLKNRVNMMRGKIGHFNLGGDDPFDVMPNLLLVESKNGRDIDPFELMKMIAKFDTADLRPLAHSQYLVATSCERKMKMIESAIAKTGTFNVYWYNPRPKINRENSLYIAITAISLATIFYVVYTSRTP